MRRDPAFFVSVAQFTFWRWAFHFANQQKLLTNGWSRVSLNFRDHFGIVWSTRLTMRINEVAHRERWPWKLTADGLESVSKENHSIIDSEEDPRVERTFRWLLTPFVDPEWIDERLTASTDRASGD